jgi:hypothetical protein
MYDHTGSSFDYANVIYAVLQDCEHRRRSFSDETAGESLTNCAREKLARIRQSYLEGMGSKGYWRELEREVLETVIPQYVPAAIEQNRKERDAYGVWRGGDLLARFLFAILGLVIGGLIISLPFIPTIENIFALAFALGGWFYPDLIRMMHERRHFKLLNRFVTDGETYQLHRARYVSSADLEGDEDEEPPTETADTARRSSARTLENRNQ